MKFKIFKKCEKGAEITEELVSAINYLLPQLSTRAKKITLKQLREILGQENFILVVLREDDKIIGMGSLWFQKTLMGYGGKVGDIIIDEKFQGRGLGEKLVKKLFDLAKKQGVDYLGWTSNPKRVAANNLYRKLGAYERDTNVYRLDFKNNIKRRESK